MKKLFLSTLIVVVIGIHANVGAQIITTTTSVPPPPPECYAVINPTSANIYSWETVQFSTTVHGECNAPCYTWEVMAMIGTGGIINATGLYTAGSSPGADRVIVKDACNENITDSAIVNILSTHTTTISITTTTPPTTTTTIPNPIPEGPDVALTIGDGSGFPGSGNNSVEVSLNNPSDIVEGLQVDIIDEGDYLTCTGCTPDPLRASQFYCSVRELSDGGCRVVMFHFGTAQIQTGAGSLFTIDYSIDESAPAGECRGLNPEEVKVSGENNQSLDVESVPGELCFLSCLVDGECNDENECTDDTCEASQCVHECNAISPSEPCCNDPACALDSVCINSSDTDQDGIPNVEDNCPDNYNVEQTNSDSDSRGDVCDNCPDINNEDQADSDDDGIGDVCDEDIPCGDVWPPESSPGAMDCGNADVDIFDILEEIDFSIILKTPDACQLPRADVYTGTPPYCLPPDGNVNILDVVVIVDQALGRTSCCVEFECMNDEDCDDGIFCNGAETCDVGSGVCQPATDPCPDDDGLYCNGDEGCDEESDVCTNSGDPCVAPYLCDEVNDQCVMADAIITPGDIFCTPGQTNACKKPICLDNPEALVGGIQFDMCEYDMADDSIDCMACIDCELSERTTMFDCAVLELPNGCCRVILFCKNPGCAINPGLCDIVTIVYEMFDLSEDCPGTTCITQIPENIIASDYEGYELTTAGLPGTVCPFVCGDVCPPDNDATSVWDCGDGVVDIYDVMCEVDFALTGSTPDDCQAPRADVPTGTPPDCTSPDGDIDILDIMVLIDMALNRQDCCSFYYTGVIY